MSIKLKSDFEIEHGFKYDWVILGRFDLGSAAHIFRLKFFPNNDKECIYFPQYNQINAGPHDAWLYSNSNNINYMGSLYDFLQYEQTDIFNS